MKMFHGALIAATVVAAVAASAALAQTPAGQPAYVVTYIDVTPSAEGETAGLLRALAAASRRETGVLRYETLQGIGRRSQFAILEAWSDAKAFEAHRGGAAMKQFREALNPLRIGYYDERPDTGIDIGPVSAPASNGAVYVITHVDVTGQFKDEAIVMMKKLAADSRREPGAERFEVWQQNNRLNHFTVVEIWKDQAALDAHGRAAASSEFRDKAGPMLGALYDDRRYSNLE
jgi:quinol monooxygenase YgiN